MWLEQKPLSEVMVGKRAIVKHLLGGKECNKHLLVLGFTIGAEVVVLHNYGSGPVIISVKDARVALGRGEAKKVIVGELGE